MQQPSSSTPWLLDGAGALDGLRVVSVGLRLQTVQVLLNSI